MTHTPPSEFMDDPIMFAAFRDEAEAASWTDMHELLALNVEVMHAQYRQALASAGAKQNEIPSAMRIPRPWDPKPQRIGALEAARAMMGGGS